MVKLWKIGLNRLGWRNTKWIWEQTLNQVNIDSSANKCKFSLFAINCCWDTDEEGCLIPPHPLPPLQPLQPQWRTQRSQGAEARPRGLQVWAPFQEEALVAILLSVTSESSVEAPRKTAPKSSPAKKKIKEFLVTYGMQLLMVALFLVIPLTHLLCLATDTVQSCHQSVFHFKY